MNDILLAVGFYAADGTSTTAEPLDGKLRILEKCLESCAQSGASHILLWVTGDASALSKLKMPCPVTVLDCGDANSPIKNFLQAPRKVIDYAKLRDFRFIVITYGDTFHPHPEWARNWLARLQAGGVAHAMTAAVDLSRNDICTKVMCGYVNFFDQVWPTNAGLDDCGERVLTGNIAQLGFLGEWLRLPSRYETNCGSAYYPPTDPVLNYFHTHSADLIGDWKMENA